MDCITCKRYFVTVDKYNAHQYYHRNLPNIRFFCKHIGCFSEYVKYKTFRMHLYRSHLNKPKIDTTLLYTCTAKCCKFKTRVKTEIPSHMYSHLKGGLFVTCPYSNCLKPRHIYKTISGLKSHFYRDHHKEIPEKTSVAVDDHEVNENSTGDEKYISLCSENNNGNPPPTLSADQLRAAYIKSLATTYLTLQAKFFTTETTLQVIIDSLMDLNDIGTECIASSVVQNFQTDIRQIIKENNMLRLAHNPIDGVLRTPYMRKLYYKKNYNYVAPIEIILGNNRAFFYVPILETLIALLSNEDVRNSLSGDTIKPYDGTFRDLTDGQCFNKCGFFSENLEALRLILYQDSFEVCNPLGSARCIHKVVGIYLTLANLPPYSRSKVDQIQLVALVLERDVKEFGFSKIFETIIRDINILETEGIQLGNTKNVKGSVVAFTGDNLGSHQIGGFVQNFSTTAYFCRYCYANKVVPRKTTSFPLRSVTSHDVDVAMALTSGQQVNGVKLDSVLNKCKYFHICNPGLPPCLAHDVFEGVLQYDFMLCINSLVTKKVFTLDLLNQKLQNKKLRFSHEFKHEKVPILKKGNKLIGSASENLRVILIFPFAVSEFINNDPCWELLRSLREICCLLMAFKISIGQVAYLKCLVDDYIALRSELFPDIGLRPKHHYLTHYPYLIRMFGPLRHVWTLRYESKHRYFKNILKHSPNFKNILLTLSERHQLLQAFHASQGNLFSDKVISDDAVPYVIQDYEITIESLISKTCTFKSHKFVTTKASFRGVCYTEGMNVCCGQTQFDDFILCTIKYVIINENYTEVFFIGKETEITYNQPLGLFEEAEVHNNLIGIHYNDLLCIEPLMHLVVHQKSWFSFKSAAFQRL